MNVGAGYEGNTRKFVSMDGATAVAEKYMQVGGSHVIHIGKLNFLKYREASTRRGALVGIHGGGISDEYTYLVQVNGNTPHQI